MKNSVLKEIDAISEEVCEISDKIWDFSELSLDEYRSSECLISFFRKHGFEIKENLCSVPTAFYAKYGKGKPVIAILGEYDALDGLSQKAGVFERSPRTETKSGHGCGHNLLGAGSAAAAVALKKYLENHDGTVIFFGCPGEEGYASKTIMAKNGVFSDVDAALSWHPAYLNGISVGSNQASVQIEYTFTGISSHAAESPFNGRSALDAVELMNVGVQFLREHIMPKDALHYAITDTGGISPNVVQPIAKVMYMFRSDNVKNAAKLIERTNNIAKGAALMTDTAVSYKLIDGTSDLVSNSVIEKILYDNLLAVSLPEYDNEEKVFASALFESCKKDGTIPEFDELSDEDKNTVSVNTDNWSKPLNNFIMPYTHSDKYITGSTDVGDVSRVVPTAQITSATWVSLSPGHSWQNVSIGRTSIAHKGMLFASKVLALTAIDLFENEKLLNEAKAEFKLKNKDGYFCPLDI